MSLRRRVTLVAAAAVTVAMLLASVVGYFVMSAELHGEVDDSLSARAEQISTFQQRIDRIRGAPPPGAPGQIELPPPDAPAKLGGATGYVQLVGADGGVLQPGRDAAAALPVSDRVRGLARNGGGSYFS